MGGTCIRAEKIYSSRIWVVHIFLYQWVVQVYILHTWMVRVSCKKHSMDTCHVHLSCHAITCCVPCILCHTRSKHINLRHVASWTPVGVLDVVASVTSSPLPGAIHGQNPWCWMTVFRSLPDLEAWHQNIHWQGELFWPLHLAGNLFHPLV